MDATDRLIAEMVAWGLLGFAVLVFIFRRHL